jgi:hypothetical protein
MHTYVKLLQKVLEVIRRGVAFGAAVFNSCRRRIKLAEPQLSRRLAEVRLPGIYCTGSSSASMLHLSVAHALHVPRHLNHNGYLQWAALAFKAIAVHAQQPIAGAEQKQLVQFIYTMLFSSPGLPTSPTPYLGVVSLGPEGVIGAVPGAHPVLHLDLHSRNVAVQDWQAAAVRMLPRVQVNGLVVLLEGACVLPLCVKLIPFCLQRIDLGACHD